MKDVNYSAGMWKLYSKRKTEDTSEVCNRILYYDSQVYCHYWYSVVLAAAYIIAHNIIYIYIYIYIYMY